MNMLGLKQTVDGLAIANGIGWYEHVVRRNDRNVLRVALDLEVTGIGRRERPKETWKKQVKEEAEMINLKKEDVLNRAKWTDKVGTYCRRSMVNRIISTEGRHRIKTEKLLLLLIQQDLKKFGFRSALFPIYRMTSGSILKSLCLLDNRAKNSLVKALKNTKLILVRKSEIV